MISRYFKLSEVTYSATAKRLGIDNSISGEHLENAKKLGYDILDELAMCFGRDSIKVTSWYRSKNLNNAIAGASITSQHCKGCAVDIKGVGVTNRTLFNFIASSGKFDQLIWEHGDDRNPAWIHVSYDPNGSNRKQKLRAVKDKKGKTIYNKY